MPTTLDQLLDPNWEMRHSSAAHPSALRFSLEADDVVDRIRTELHLNLLSMDEINAFTEQLVKCLTPGVLLEHDYAIAAIVVALEPLQSTSAEKYIAELASLNVAEMIWSIRVAREILASRPPRIANMGKRVEMAPPGAPASFKVIDISSPSSSIEIDPTPSSGGHG